MLDIISSYVKSIGDDLTLVLKLDNLAKEFSQNLGFILSCRADITNVFDVFEVLL